MKVGFVSQWYEPEAGAAAHPTAVANVLAQHGHDVTVLTGVPNYPKGEVFEEYRGRGRVTERWGGIRVHRVPYWTSHDASAVRRAKSYLSFALAASRHSGLLQHVDVCLVYASPATVVLPAIALQKRRSIPFVLYVQDLWPDSVAASGFIASTTVGRCVEEILRIACRESYKRAAAVATIAPGMRDVVVARTAADEKTDVVFNWVDEGVFKPTAADEDFAATFRTAEDFIVMYAGGLGNVQGLDVAVHAMTHLKDLCDLRLVFVGNGVAEGHLRALAVRLGVANRIVFTGGFPLERMPAVMACSDVQLISLKDLDLFHYTIPSKVQAAMATGLPLVVSAPGDARRLVEDADAGLTAEPGDDVGLAKAIRTVYMLSPEERAKYGEHGRTYYLQRLGSEVGARRLTELLAWGVGQSR